MAVTVEPLSEADGLRPVFVKTEYKENVFSFGVQFWSESLIKAGKSRNPDGTLTELVKVM